MKKREQYELRDAVKSFYKTEPLQADLANSVANKVFARRRVVSRGFDKWLYAFAAILFAGGMIYCFSIVRHFSISLILLLMIPVGCHFVLAAKEHWLISKRLLSFQ